MIQYRLENSWDGHYLCKIIIDNSQFLLTSISSILSGIEQFFIKLSLLSTDFRGFNYGRVIAYDGKKRE
jgi:hypothetical protein